ncbi:MAG TPA: hypothetical protein VHE53_01670 [Patescibacteria group bacterium]|nr:hypothetical protein [Patescibacteria group bacterium]
MANPERSDFPKLPYTFERMGVTPDDVEEFSSMFGLGPEDTVQEVIDMNVSGNAIVALQDSYSNRGVELTRRQAAHLYYDKRFLNRTVDYSQQPQRRQNKGRKQP